MTHPNFAPKNITNNAPNNVNKPYNSVYASGLDKPISSYIVNEYNKTIAYPVN